MGTTARVRSLSIFEQSLDRASAIVYFLGAVVPLGALGWLVVRETRPLAFDARADWFIGALGLVGALTLVSFFALRRLTRAVMQTVERENASRARMLGASRALAAAKDAEGVLRVASLAMAEIVGARDAVAFVRNRAGELEPRGAESSEARARDQRAELSLAAAEALSAGRPSVRSVTGEGSAIAVPCTSGTSAPTALSGWISAGGAPAAAELEVLATLGSLTAVALDNADLRQAERNFFTHATNLLVATLDRYLDDRSDHSRRVAALANQISHALELPERQRERLHFAALLHDIGMLHIPREHADDRVLARRHVELGDEMLRPIRFWEDLAVFVRHHHERWDGEGYPDGLAGERIPLESRIIAVSEAFDAMTAAKSYKPAISVDEALGRLEAAAGSQFDPTVVQAFLATRREPT